ncbi:MAG: ribose 5-phosphate isomerase B [Candidatus Promineifilaceae bacterium]
MKLVIGADHAGFELKQWLAEQLRGRGHELVDVGAHRYERDDDYPDFAAAVARAVTAGEGERGILVCGSGVGACVAANKIQGARACLCHDIYSAVQGVEHDDMNILCLGGLIVGRALALKLVEGFVAAEFIGSGRYLRRLEKVIALDEAQGGS